MERDMDDDKIISLREVQNFVPLSRSTLWRMERVGTFPRRVRIGVRRIGWHYSDIQEWIDSRRREASSTNEGAESDA